MSFKSLEQRFNENVKTLYAGATLKFEDGKPSNGNSDDPIITRAPGKGYWGAMESRATPVRSAAQDVKRLTLFQLSSRGIQFLAKQQLLQTGNTFEFTRALNPAFVVGNAVPFLHIKRNLRPLSELAGKTDRSDGNVRTMGQLQNNTYNQLKSKTLAPFILQQFFGRPGKPSNSLLGNLKNSLLGPLNSLKNTVTNTISAFNPLQKKNIGELKDKWGVESWKVSRPELVTYVKGMQSGILTQYQQRALNDTKQSFSIRTGAGVGSTTDRYSDIDLIPTEQKIISFIKYFDRGQSLGTADAGTDKPNSFLATRNGQRGYLPNNGKISYIKDPSNLRVPSVNDLTNALTIPPAYNSINSNFDDPVTVSFAMGKESPIKFRAFIKDLVESSNPQYQTFQYIGRVEKFINYTGIQREVSFKLAVLAYGPDELDMVWRRINYLTGLTFPYGFTRGIMQPNIVRLTVGAVYTNQPGYITALSTNFNEPAGSWDIDRDVPIGATMDMKFTIIEKATRTAQSPFYGITDGSGRAGGKEMPGFSNKIPVPIVPNTSLDPKNAPAIAPLTTRTDRKVPTSPEYVTAPIFDPLRLNVPTVNVNIPAVNVGSVEQPPIFRNNLLPSNR